MGRSQVVLRRWYHCSGDEYIESILEYDVKRCRLLGDAANDRSLLLWLPRRSRGGDLRDSVAAPRALVDGPGALQSAGGGYFVACWR